MSLSGSTDLTWTAQEICYAAIRINKGNTSEDTPGTYELTDALQSLNMIIKQASHFPGFKAWLRVSGSLTLSSSISYTLKPSGGDLDISIPTEIITATLKDSDSDETPLAVMTEEEYNTLSNKTNTGDPSRYFYKRDLSEGTIYFDYIPSDTTKTVDIVGRKMADDLDSSSDDLEFPVEWARFFKFQLALDNDAEYRTFSSDDFIKIKSQRDEALELVKIANPEWTDAYFQPEAE